MTVYPPIPIEENEGAVCIIVPRGWGISVELNTETRTREIIVYGPDVPYPYVYEGQVLEKVLLKDLLSSKKGEQ